MKRRRLYCACCGGVTYAYKQWFNQDTGYGVCQRCFQEVSKKEGYEEAVRTYGRPGVHHSIEEGKSDENT
jgi:hypothetical protein